MAIVFAHLNTHSWGTVYGFGIDESRDLAILSSKCDGVRTLDISNPLSPSVLDTLDDGTNQLGDITLAGNFVYAVASGVTGGCSGGSDVAAQFREYSVITPSSIAYIGNQLLTQPGPTPCSGGSLGQYLSQTFAIVGGSSVGFQNQVVDTPGSPTPVVQTGGSAVEYNVSTEGDQSMAFQVVGSNIYVYVVWRDKGFAAYQAISGTSFTHLADYLDPSPAGFYVTGLAIYQNYLYVATQSQSYIYDITNPSAATQVGTLPGSLCFDVKETYLIGGFGTTSLWDLSGDPTSPTLLASGPPGASRLQWGTTDKVYLISSNNFQIWEVQGLLAPIADFSATPLKGSAVLPVQFIDLSVQAPISWSWVFGDGGTSFDQNPLHSYALAGKHTVTLTATNDEGSDAETKTDYIEVFPVANFTVDVSAGDAPLSVKFTDTSIGSPDAWAWDFGDGTVSSLQNPTHVYNDVGNYTIRLIVSKDGLFDNTEKAGLVSATRPSSTPAYIIDFTAVPDTGLRPLSVQFINASTIPLVYYEIQGYDWDFGDGEPHSTDENPLHVYTAAGDYDVTLTISLRDV